VFRRRSEYFNRRTATEQLARERINDPALRLTLARIYAEGGDFARAINQYQVYLTFKPKDTAVKKELTTLVEDLKRNGRLPAMDVFNGMAYARVGQPPAASPSNAPSSPPPGAADKAAPAGAR